ncbi:MAG TPA: tetratricopeptide repeat protein [Candidatus Acidoferrales bacterium]|nr:tetratricopeptide repeat protein [Candidatus Acidoferrales bacterium]
MSKRPTATRESKSAAPRARQAAAQRPDWLPYLAAAAIPALVLLWAYSPVMHTGFLFDDTNQMFARPEAAEPLRAWIGPVRPVLMFTYWMNVQLSNQDTFSYHAVNLLIHSIAAMLVFLVIRRLMEWAGSDPRLRTWMAAFGAALFLLHPLQTESVAYVAGRSEALSGMFAAASIAVFLYRKSAAISWTEVGIVLVTFGAALLSKEQAVVVPLVLLLTDYWWNPGFSLRGIFRNWKLYALMAAGGLAGVALFWKMILGIGTNSTAGFGMKDFTWYQYLFTQFRVLFVYLANFVLPLNLNLDWEFPISRTILDRGAIFGLAVLVTISVAAWRYRTRFRLASYGWFLFLVLLLPTSSVLPIKDPIADRRMYLPMLGLILVAIDFLGRWKADRKTVAALCAGILVFMAALTHARAVLWSDAVALWEDTVSKSPGRSRPHFQLAMAYYDQGRFDRSVAEFEKAASLDKPDVQLLLDWGLAYDGLHQPEKALEKLRQAAALGPTAHIYTQIGKVYADQRRWKEAMDAFATAEKLDPAFPATFAYKGLVHLANNDPAAAIPECRHALELDSRFQPARECLATAARMGGR